MTMIEASWKYIADKYYPVMDGFFAPRYAVIATIGERRIRIVERFYWFANAKRYAKRLNKELRHLEGLERLHPFGPGGGGGG